MKPLTQWTTADIVDFFKSVDKKTWINIGIGLGVALLFFIFIAIPAWFIRPGIKNRLKDIEGQIQIVQTLSLKKPILLRTKTKAIDFIKKSKERLFKPGETSLLLGAISKLANESKVSIVASSPKDAVEKFPDPFVAKYEANLYEFTLEGGFHEMGSFVGKIESNPKMFRVQNFQLRPNQTKGKEDTQIASLTVAAISVKEGAPA